MLSGSALSKIQNYRPAEEKIKFAEQYIKMGWHIIPIHYPANGECSCRNPDCSNFAKHPITKRGHKDASNDLNQIQEWLYRWPNANISIATGKISNLVVLDIDPRHGGDKELAELEKAHQPLSRLGTVLTGGNGLHYYFKTNLLIKNRTNLRPGIDVRGEGGFIIAPPSIHKSDLRYNWEDQAQELSIPDLPDWLLSILVSKKREAPRESKRRSVPEGIRNDTLTSLAGLLRKHNLDRTLIEKCLLSLNHDICQPPLDSSEIRTIAKSISSYPTPSSWQAPLPLPEINIKPPSLSEDLIPSPLKSWITDIADRMQVPAEFVAAPAIVSFSSLVGRKIGIMPKREDDWLVIPNLWGALVARPGFFKSPAISEAMKPLEIVSKRALDEFNSQKNENVSHLEVLKAKIEGLKDTIKKQARKRNNKEISDLQNELTKLLHEKDQSSHECTRYKTNDTTVEKLAILLQENPNGLMIIRDELSGWLRSLNKAGREGDREFYLEAWNGYGSYTVDRVSRDSVFVSALCLSVFGGIQPGKLDSYVFSATKGGKEDDGFLQRFQLLVYPETSPTWKNVDRRPDEEAQRQALRVFEYAAYLEVSAQKKFQEISVMRFSDDAQKIFDHWRESLESRLRSGVISSPAFESHLAKYRSLLPSLALLFRLMRAAQETPTGPIAIEEEDINLSIGWCSFLEEHAKKIYRCALYPEVRSAQALARKITTGDVVDKDKLRSIYRHHWSHIDTPEKLDQAIALLEKHHWVRTETISFNNCHSEILRINPLLNRQTHAMQQKDGEQDV